MVAPVAPPTAAQPISAEHGVATQSRGGSRSFLDRFEVREHLLDALVLALVIFVPALLYLPGLGFYSDDWHFFQLIEAPEAPGERATVVEAISRLFPDWSMRPAYAFYLGLRYALFGTAPLGYHLVNHVVMWLGLVLLVLVLRRLGFSRALAMSAAIIFGLMPAYSTLRFWIGTDHTPLSLTLYLLSLWIDLRAPSRSLGRTVGWRVLSAVAALLSGLLYELCILLLLVNPLVAWWHRRGRPGLYGFKVGVPNLRTLPRPDRLLLLHLGVNACVVAAIVAVKIRSPRIQADEGVTLIGRLLRLVRGVLNHHGWIHGLGEPLSIYTILTRYFDLWALLLSVVCGVAVSLYVYWLLTENPLVQPVTPASSLDPDSSEQTRAARRHLLLVVALGVAVLGLGYAIFVTNDQFYFSAAGTTNRITQVGALGVALALAGVFGLLATLPSRPNLRRSVLSGLVGAYGGAGVLILTTIGGFWDQASVRQRAIIADMERAVPTMPPGSALLLDGECPYIGPAVVFETFWDLQGVLRLVHRDQTLRGNVVTPRLEVTDQAVTTWLTTPAALSSYPYASGLVVYNRASDVAVPIRSADEMRAYLARYNPDRGERCPFGWTGNGVTILPRPLS